MKANGDNFYIWDYEGVSRHRFRINDAFVIGASGAEQSLGTSSTPWADVFSVNALTVTSDERLKDWKRSGLSDKEYKAGQAMLAERGSYVWKDGGKRIHFGARAQRIFKCLEDQGLKPADYAFCMYDEWEKETEPTFSTRKVKKEVEVLRKSPFSFVGIKGKLKKETIEVDEQYEDGEIVIIEAGDKYGLREGELEAFLGMVRDRQYKELEAKFDKLNKRKGKK